MSRNLDRVSRIARCWSNTELRRFGHFLSGDVVNVSAGEDVDKEGNAYASYFPNASSYSITNFAPGAYRGYQGRANEQMLDLSKELPAEMEEKFDVVFNHTTLEHVIDVPLAFRNLCRMTRDLVIAVVPFAQVQHDTDGYLDYWRIGPSAIRRLCKDNSMTLVYESCNDDFNAGIYIFFVASKHPDKWVGKFPAYEPLGMSEVRDQRSEVGDQRSEGGGRRAGGRIGEVLPEPYGARWPVRIKEAIRYVLTGKRLWPQDERVGTVYEFRGRRSEFGGRSVEGSGRGTVVSSKHIIMQASDVVTNKVDARLTRIIHDYCKANQLQESGIRVLDWGSGRGMTVATLRRDGIDAYGVEIDAIPFNNGVSYFAAEGIADAVQLIGSDCKTTFPDGWFDIVFSEQVLEHIKDLGPVCAEMSRITKPGGKGLHIYPAKWHLNEVHLKMPFLHWLPKNSIRYGLVYFYVLLGREPHWETAKDFSCKDVAMKYYEYSKGKTFYRSEKEVHECFMKHGITSHSHTEKSTHRCMGLSIRWPFSVVMTCSTRKVVTG